MIAIQTEDINVNLGMFQLQDISLSIPKGKMTAIIGPNGSGKSTFLKIVTQLLQKDDGSISVLDKELKAYKRKEFAHVLTMMPQSKDMLPDLTVREIVSFGRSPYQGVFSKQNKQADEEAVEWALIITGTKKHEDRMFHTMSGGEQQKVRIAMALAQKTDILLLDEPTTFLDIAHQLDLMELLQKINGLYGITVVMVLHELQQAAKYCHQLIAMKKGKVVTTGSPKEILTSQFFKEVYEIDAKVLFDEDYPLIIPMNTATI
ncbi:MAG: ABC transporter ATP-binding protein [Bacillus sp. (in: firmicutes)]